MAGKRAGRAKGPVRTVPCGGGDDACAKCEECEAEEVFIDPPVRSATWSIEWISAALEEGGGGGGGGAAGWRVRQAFPRFCECETTTKDRDSAIRIPRLEDSILGGRGVSRRILSRLSSAGRSIASSATAILAGKAVSNWKDADTESTE